MRPLTAKSALHTRVGRRFLLLFFVSAFVPVCALAALTWREVRTQLRHQAQDRVRDDAKRLALDVVGRLQHAAREVRDVAMRPDLRMSDQPDAMIDQVAVLGLEDESLRGAPGHWEPLTPAQQTRLRAPGAAVLMHRAGPASDLWMATLSAADPGVVVAGRIRAGRLIDDAIDQTLQQSSIATLRNEHGDVVFAGAGAEHWPQIPSATSGLLTWRDDEAWVGAYFKPPLAALYGVSHWTVGVAEREDDAYAPVKGFLRQFALVVIFTLGVVSLLSLSQVRRELVPLALLREGTKQLAARDFRTPIVLDTGDEFEELAVAFDQMRGNLRQTFDTLATLSEIDRAILSTVDADRVVSEVVTRLAEVVPSAAIACVVIRDAASSSTMVWRAGNAVPVLTLVGGAVPPHEFAGVREWTARERDCAPGVLRPLMHDDASRLLSVPVRVADRLAAVLVVARVSAAPFAASDRDIVSQIGQQVAVALTNAGLVQRLEHLNLGTLNALARTIDAKSPWTAGHSERVTSYGLALARAVGVDESSIGEMRRGGLLHDIGKIGIPNEILDKPGRLTPEELRIIQRHPELGARILEPIADYARAIPIVLEHHERWDGAGYPYGLRGEAISLGGRIFALADVFDALTSDRPYRAGLSVEAVIAMFTRETGHHFDPGLAPVFIDLIPTLGRNGVAPDGGHRLGVVGDDASVALDAHIPYTKVG